MSITVNFTDTSVAGPSGPIVSWQWFFGDGETSTDESPSHDYDDSFAGGRASVRLLITGTDPDGTDSATTTLRFAP